jgi:hypothetical protein
MTSAHLTPTFEKETITRTQYGLLPDWYRSVASGYDHVCKIVVTPHRNPAFVGTVRTIIQAAANTGAGVVVQNMGRSGPEPPVTSDEFRPITYYVLGTGWQNFKVVRTSNHNDFKVIRVDF